MRIVWIVPILIVFLFPVKLPAQENEQIARLYLDKADQLLRSGDIAGAVELAEASLQFVPENSDALFLLASEKYNDRSSSYTVIELCQQALRFAAWRVYSESDCVLLLSNVYDRAKQYTRVIELLEPEIGKVGVSSRALFLYAKALIESGKRDRGQMVLQRGIALYPDIPLLRRLLVRIDEAYREKLTGAFLNGNYFYDHYETVLVDLIQLSVSAEEKQELIKIYRDNGGSSPVVVLEELDSMEGDNRDPDRVNELLELFAGSGGFENALLTFRFTELARELDLFEKASALAGEFTGNTILDSNSDGYFEILYKYEQGLLQRMVVDFNQDGITEYDITFREGKPDKVEGTKGGSYISMMFSRYPFAEKLIAEQPGTRTTYRFIPGYFSFPVLLFPEMYELSGVLFKPELNEMLPVVRKDDLKDSVLDIREETLHHGGPFYIWEPLQEESSWLLGEFDDLGRVIRKIVYRQGIPVEGLWDTDRDSVFEVTVRYIDGEQGTLYYDGNQNTVHEFSLDLGEEDMQFWDFNEDGIIDCRETIMENAKVLREYSSRMNGIFDITIFYKDRKILYLSRSGKRKNVYPAQGEDYYWIGEPIDIDVPGDLPLKGSFTADGLEFSVFTQFEYTYIEAVE